MMYINGNVRTVRQDFSCHLAQQSSNFNRKSHERPIRYSRRRFAVFA